VFGFCPAGSTSKVGLTRRVVDVKGSQATSEGWPLSSNRVITNMRKKLAISFALVIAFTMHASAQVGRVIRTNLTDVLVGRYSLGGEVFISEHHSLGLDVDYVSKEVSLSSDHPWYPGGSTEKRGVILEPQLRWYLGQVVGQGAYASVSGFFGYARYNPVDEENWGVIPPPEWLAGGSSLHLGNQQRIKRFLLDVYLGVTWAQNKDMGIFYEDRALFPQPSGFRVSGGLRLGFYTQESK